MAYPQAPKKANVPAIVAFVCMVVVSAAAVVVALIVTGDGGSDSAGNGSGSGETSSSTPTSGANDSGGASGGGAPGGDPPGPPADPTPVLQVVADAINAENPEGVKEIACDDTAGATMTGFIDSLTQVHPTATVLGAQPVDDDTFRGMIGITYTDPTDATIEKTLVIQIRKDGGDMCALSLSEAP